MLICKDCGAVFEQPRITYESHDYGEGSALEEWALCPSCGESGFEEAKECTRCGEYGHRDNMQLDDNLNYLCEVCYEELYD